MNHARAYLGVAVVDGKIYAIGGDEGSETGNCMTGTAMTNNVVNYTEEYDPAQNIWTQKADMPTKRALFGTAVYGGKIFCIGGYNGATVVTGPESWDWKTEYYDVVANEVYDPASNSWQTMAALPTPRYSTATNIVDGKIYVIGGHTMTDLYITLSITEVYDPATDSWVTKTPAPLPVSSYASAVIDNKIYVLGTNPDANWERNIMVYDPATDMWTIKNKAPIGYATTVSATTGANALKRIYYFDENRTDIYNPTSDTWSTGTPAPTTNRLIAAAIAVDDAVYLVGGRTGQWGYMTFMYPSNITERYHPMVNGSPDQSEPTHTPTPSPSTTTMPTAIATEDNQETDEPINQDITFPTLPLIGILATVIVIGIAVSVWKIRKRAY